jgi:hypothetical protein
MDHRVKPGDDDGEWSKRVGPSDAVMMQWPRGL